MQKKMIFSFTFILLLACFYGAAPAHAKDLMALDTEQAVLETSMGTIVLGFFPVRPRIMLRTSKSWRRRASTTVRNSIASSPAS